MAELYVYRGDPTDIPSKVASSTGTTPSAVQASGWTVAYALALTADEKANLDEFMATRGYVYALTLTGDLSQAAFDPVALVALPSDPAALLGINIIYAKTVSGVVELFSRRSNGAIVQLTPTSVPTESYTLAGGLALLDLVRQSVADTADKANASGIATMPAIGFVRSLGPTDNIQTGGELAGFVGLTPGATYYASTVAGNIVTPAPTGPSVVQQAVGRAKNATTLFVNISINLAELAPP